MLKPSNKAHFWPTLEFLTEIWFLVYLFLSKHQISYGEQTYTPNFNLLFFFFFSWSMKCPYSNISAAYFGNNSFGAWFSSVVCILPQWRTPPLHAAGTWLSWCAVCSQAALPISAAQAAPSVEQFSLLAKSAQRLPPSDIFKKRTDILFALSGFKHSRLLIPSGLGRLPSK